MWSHLKISHNPVGSTNCVLLDLCYEDECMANYPIAAGDGFGIRKVVDLTATGRLKSKFVWRQETPPVSTAVLNTEKHVITEDTDPSGHTVEGVGLWPLTCGDCGFEPRRGHGCLSHVSVLCCQAEVSATGRSLIQRKPTECARGT